MTPSLVLTILGGGTVSLIVASLFVDAWRHDRCYRSHTPRYRRRR